MFYDRHEAAGAKMVEFGGWEMPVMYPTGIIREHLATRKGAGLFDVSHMGLPGVKTRRELLPLKGEFFGRALTERGMDVAGDPVIDYTETHQVVVKVGYGLGPEIAGQLEANNIICNYQAIPSEEGFTAAGALRLGDSEMTRFGMEKDDFRELAGLIHDVVKKKINVQARVKAFRQRFRELQFCFKRDEFSDLFQTLHALL